MSELRLPCDGCGRRILYDDLEVVTGLDSIHPDDDRLLCVLCMALPMDWS